MQRRTSGEAEAFRDEESSAGTAEVTGKGGPPASPRPYPIWVRIEAGKRRLPPRPRCVSLPRWARLSRQIGAYLRLRLGNALTLRQVVRALAAEMLLAGASAEEVRTTLQVAVMEHPERDVLDRMNVVTRRPVSEELLERVLAWAAEVGA